MLGAIIDLFRREWARQICEDHWILGKPARDLVVCGAGIAKFDMPALFCRATVLGVVAHAEAYDLFLKARSIDLANTANFLFAEDPTLYPKTTKEMAGRLGVSERKGSSKSVWDLHAAGDHKAIEQRTEAELRTIIEIYQRVRTRIAPHRA